MKKTSKISKEIDDLKMAYENARQVRKHTKAALKAEKKAVKMHLTPFKLAYKQAIKVEKETKEMLKRLDKTALKSEEVAMGAVEKSKKNKAKDKKEKKVKKGTPKISSNVSTAANKSEKAVSVAAPVSAGADDFTKIKGVGARVAKMLQANGIMTYSDMAATPVEKFRDLLRDNNMSKFRNPTNWAKVAAQLAKMPPAEPKKPGRRGRKPGTGSKLAEKASVTPKTTGSKTKTEKAVKPLASKRTLGAKKEETGTKATAIGKKTRGRKSVAKPSTGGDDLTTIKGVGVKVAKMLSENGIRTFQDMAATSYDRFKELLRENNMSKFRDPTNWASTAAGKAKG